MKNLITILGILILLLFIPLSFINSTTGFIPELFVFIALILFFRWTYSIWRLNVPIFTLLIVGLISHSAGILGWYHTSPVPIQWDHVTHVFGLLPFALLFFRFFEQWMDAKLLTRKNLLLVIVVFLAASGVGALIELSEFLGYLKLGFGEGAFRFGPGDGFDSKAASDVIADLGGGWINTGWDLIYNTSGIVIGIILMLITKLFVGTPKKAYYYETPGQWSKKVE